MKKFQNFSWDYPSQGQRHPRTMNEAFGPYAELHVEREHIPSSKLEIIVFILLLAAVLAAVFS